MNDLISRQAAIDAVCESCSLVGDYHKCDGYPKDSIWCEEITALRKVPSAQSERKRGKWVDVMTEEWCTFDECKCSVCGVVEYFNKGWKKFSYCPNCGSFMGEKDDQA